MKHRLKHTSGFTIVELLIVIVVIAILAAVVMVSYNNIQKRARDSIRLQDVANLQKAFEVYRTINGAYPQKSPAASSADWARSTTQPNDYVSGITGGGDGAILSQLPVDPINDSSSHYKYYLYPPGSKGCDPSRGSFYVLEIQRMETGAHPNEKSPGWKCSGGRDWSGDADYVVGKFEH